MTGKIKSIKSVKSDKGNGKHRVIMSFLLSYITILVVTLLISSLVYRQALVMIEDSITESNLSLLEQTRDITDSRLNEIEKISYQLALDPRTAIFLNRIKPMDDTAYYNITNYIPYLRNYWLTNNDFVLDFFIYFNKMDLMVNSKTFYSMSNFYGNFFRYDDWDSSEFEKNILNTVHNAHYLPVAPITFGDFSESKIPYNAVTYLQTIPIGRPGGIKGTIMVFIDNTKIINLLKRINTGSTGWVYITDKDGRVLTGISNGVEIKSMDNMLVGTSGYKRLNTTTGEMMVTYTTSSRNGWRYVSVLPSSVVLSKAYFIKKLIILIILITLIIGLITAYFLAYRNTKPMRNILKLFDNFPGNENKDEKNEYSILQKSISAIINKNSNLQDALERQKEFLSIAFFHRLFRGDYNNMEKLEAAASSINLDMKGTMHAVILLKINGYVEFTSKDVLNELNMQKIIVKDELAKQLPDTKCFYDVNENKVAWLCSLDCNNNEEFKEYTNNVIKKVYDKLREEFNIDLSFSAGEICSNLLEVWRSFNEAVMFIDYNMSGKADGIIIWTGMIEKDSERFYYSLDVEFKLMNHVKSGDRENTARLLDELFHENFTERKLPYRMQQKFLSELGGTLVRLAEQLNISGDMDKILDKLDKNTSVDEFHKNVMKECLKMCDSVNQQKKSRNIQLKDKVLDYINGNYMDPNICLYSVASSVKLSETYLSQFFKEQTGENFVNYLERIRINHACELLSGDNMPIGEVANAIGYNSDHVFRRAFKRFMGLNPSEYKNSLNSAKSTLS